MTRRLTLLLVVILLAGCGTHARPTVRVPAPKLPRALAAELAQKSDDVARKLELGDSCGALGSATDLQRRTIDAINAGHVPERLQEPLQAAVNRLATTIRCVPPQPEKHHGKHEDEKKHGKHK